MEVDQSSDMSAVGNPRFSGVKELVDLELGAKADARAFPEVVWKSPKGAADLGDSARDFLFDVDLTVQGASQVSEFIHIIDHFTFTEMLGFL